jgi:hypothetical protein
MGNKGECPAATDTDSVSVAEEHGRIFRVDQGPVPLSAIWREIHAPYHRWVVSHIIVVVDAAVESHMLSGDRISFHHDVTDISYEFVIKSNAKRNLPDV